MSSSPTAVDFDRAQRTFDLVCAGLGLLISAPVWVVLAVLVKASSPGPILYRAERVGRGGRPFRLYKFRSMTANADRAGPGVTRAGDTRVTPVGRWLRRTKLDELPQLFNVLRGEMSLVGPRPEDPRYVALYGPEQRRVLDVRPGITGVAAIHYRNEEALLRGPDWETQYVQVVMVDKLRLELAYLQRRTVWSDLGLLWQTVVAVLR